jgi:tetratricopeptide (TPR) repeat protein
MQSFDELLGTERERRDARYKEIQDEVYKKVAYVVKGSPYNDEGKKDELVEALRQGIREFPDDYEILNWCAAMLSSVTGGMYKREAIAVYEHILRNCTESKWRTHAEFVMCWIYAELGEKERAYAIAETMPELSGTKVYVKPLISRGDGEVHVRHVQESILSIIAELLNFLVDLFEAKDGEASVYSADERFEIYDIFLGLSEFIYGSGDIPTIATEYNAYHWAVRFAMDEGRHDKALAFIERAVEFALASDSAPHRPPFKGLLVNRLNFEYGDEPGLPENYYKTFFWQIFTDENQLGALLEPIRGNPRFKAAMETLERYA